jgi:hypothetical protein
MAPPTSGVSMQRIMRAARTIQVVNSAPAANNAHAQRLRCVAALSAKGAQLADFIHEGNGEASALLRDTGLSTADIRKLLPAAQVEMYLKTAADPLTWVGSKFFHLTTPTTGIAHW